LNCEKCGKKILDETSSFCAYCGVSFDSKLKSNDFLANAGLLSITAAAFSIAGGFVGLSSYQSYVSYYSYYGAEAPGAIGFLLFAVFAVVASGFGFLGGLFLLKRRRFKLTVLGTLLMCASVVFTLVVVWQYDLGFTDGIVVSAVPTLALALISTILLVKSKQAFFNKTVSVETPEASEPSVIDEKVDESIFKD
jgi:hypothetical protein